MQTKIEWLAREVCVFEMEEKNRSGTNDGNNSDEGK